MPNASSLPPPEPERLEADVLALLAAARRNDGQFDEAIVLLRRWVGLESHNVEAWLALSECLAAARRSEAAMMAYDAALRLDSTHPEALCGKARLLQASGDVARAGALFRRALALYPDWQDALVGLAILALESERWRLAERWIDLLADSKPPFAGLEALKTRLAVGQAAVAGKDYSAV